MRNGTLSNFFFLTAANKQKRELFQTLSLSLYLCFWVYVYIRARSASKPIDSSARSCRSRKCSHARSLTSKTIKTPKLPSSFPSNRLSLYTLRGRPNRLMPPPLDKVCALCARPSSSLWPLLRTYIYSLGSDR